MKVAPTAPRHAHATYGESWAQLQVQSAWRDQARLAIAYNPYAARPWSAWARDDLYSPVFTLENSQGFSLVASRNELCDLILPWLETEYGDVLHAMLAQTVVKNALHALAFHAVQAKQKTNMPATSTMEVSGMTGGALRDAALTDDFWAHEEDA